ncbi:MAG TPA: hypothetical protein VD816_10760, partial [Ohtaekwangia sp.]|nr:hypothetical protein [Ohtaekwangia sp.]
VNRKFEVSLDLGMFNDRIMLTANLYRNRSSEQLVGIPLAPTAGFSVVQANFPAVVQNAGMEFDITAVNIPSGRNFEWVTSLNLTVAGNKLVAFPGIESSPWYDERYTVGEPLDIVKLYGYRGVDRMSGEYEFADINRDGRYNMDDRRYIRFVGPRAFGGLHNSLRFAGFQLDFLLQWVSQDGYNATHLFSRAPGMLSNQPDFVMNRWTGQGQDNQGQQRFTIGGTKAESAYANNLYYSTASVSDASFIRLKNLSLSYTLGRPIAQRLHVQELTAFVQGQNLLTITRHNGLDPENPGSTSLPPLRTLTVGIKLRI